MAKATQKQKGRGFDNLAANILNPSKKPSSLSDFLSDSSEDEATDEAKESIEANATELVKQKPVSPAVEPVQTEPEPPPVREPRGKSLDPQKKSEAAGVLKDKRSIFFSAEGSNALDDIEHYLKRAVGAHNKSKVKRSLIVDECMLLVWADIEQNGEASQLVQRILERVN